MVSICVRYAGFLFFLQSLYTRGFFFLGSAYMVIQAFVNSTTMFVSTVLLEIIGALFWLIFYI